MTSHRLSASVSFFVLTAALSAAGGPGQKPVADDVFKTGAVRFVPEITITDEALGGKAFLSQPIGVALDEKGRIHVGDA